MASGQALNWKAAEFRPGQGYQAARSGLQASASQPISISRSSSRNYVKAAEEEWTATTIAASQPSSSSRAEEEAAGAHDDLGFEDVFNKSAPATPTRNNSSVRRRRRRRPARRLAAPSQGALASPGRSFCTSRTLLATA